MQKKPNKQRRSGSVFFLIALLIVVLDQVTKSIVRSNLKIYQPIQVIGKFLSITFIQNTGAGFGTFQNFNASLVFISLIILGLILFFWDKIGTDFEKICFALIISGIIGNVIDRIVFGYVTDFIYFSFWPAFNIADSAICIGILLLIYDEFR